MAPEQGSLLPAEIWTVRQLVRRIRDRLEENFAAVWVSGEISNLKTPQSGHTYFTLKDADSQIQAVFFKFKRRYIRFEPDDGMQVLCKGVITVYEARGTVQLNVDYMEPEGLGALYLAFEQIKERLTKEGLFDTAIKKALPLVPRRIGIITSPTGAAVQDLLQIIRRRFANVEILIMPVHVQGDLAAPEIVEALEYSNRRKDLDVIILARGGGSIEDLWSFNEESVARAIHASAVPVISAVGHETDFTIADFAADVRAPTPSAAAELVVQNKAEIEEKIAVQRKRLETQIVHFLDRKRSKLDGLFRRLVSPEQRIGMMYQRLDDLGSALEKAVRDGVYSHRVRLGGYVSSLRLLSPAQKARGLRERLQVALGKARREAAVSLQTKRDRLSVLSEKLNALSPLNVLQRGYSIVYKLPEENIVRESRGISVHDRLRIRFQRGQAECIVEKTEEGDNH